MAEYIEREELRKAANFVTSDCTCPMHIAAEIEQIVDELPGADVAEVRHGKWLERGTGYGWCFICSVCGWNDGYPFNERHKYCPNCGAKMDLEDED